jgi:tetratricopeptide (TPR) repeat protein
VDGQEENRLDRWLEDKLEKQFRDQLVRGTRLLNRGKPAEALPLLERAYKLKPDNYDAALNFGGAYIMAGRFKYAVPILEAATEMHGDQPQLWVNLGAAYLGNPILADDEKQRKALDAFNRAVALDPYTPNVEYNIGLIHRDRGELQLAINAFERALKVNPNDADAKSLIARLQSKLDEDGNKV